MSTRSAIFRGLRHSGRHLASGALVALLLAGCGQSGQSSPTSQSSQSTQAGQAPPPGAPAAGGSNRGWDCATLIAPAELDQISTFTGGTISTTTRGDQNPSQPGYGECSFEEPNAPSTWFGTIAIATGDAVDAFDIQYDFNKEHGATAEPGLGTEAILNRSDAGTEIFAKGADGVGVTVSLAWDTTSTTDDQALAAIRAIVKTVLGRT